MRVVAATAMTLNSALMGNFAEAARIYLQAPVVDIAPNGGGPSASDLF